MDSRPLMQLRLATSPTQEFGSTPHGTLSVFPVTGGTFEGDRLRGTVLPGGGDWVTVRADSTMELDLRVTLETDDGALIHMSYGGRIMFPDALEPEVRDTSKRHLIDPAKYYFRTTPLFETGAPQYAWINGIVAVGSGRLVEGGGVAYDVFELL